METLAQYRKKNRQAAASNLNQRVETLDPDLLDANGRPFNFSSLFGAKIPETSDFKHTKRETVAQRKVDHLRVFNCLTQLGPPIEDRLDFEELKREREEYKEDPNYIPGYSNPWSSINFNIEEGIEVQVSYRTRVDCGLPPKQLPADPPNRRQQNILDAAYECDLYEEKSKVISEQSQLFLEKSRELNKRRLGPNYSPKKIGELGKRKSALSLTYLN
jgi:hypothetical protein